MIQSLYKIWNRLLEQIKMADHTFMVGMAIIIGVLGGLGSYAVQIMIEISQNLFFFQSLFDDHNGESLLAHIDQLEWWKLILIPAIGGAIIGPIIYWFAREAKGHGVPEVMNAVVKRDGIIRPRVVFVKAIASSICIGSGGSTGREGPIVQIGASIGSAMGQLLQLPSNKIKTLVGCGASAGIAATFNAPIAGAIFAVEIILGDFGVAQFSPIVISAVVATLVSHQLISEDQFPTFHIDIVKEYEMSGLWELFPYALLGVFGALAAIFFTRFLYKAEDIFDDLKIPEYIKPVIGGILLGVVAIQFPQVMGTGHEAIEKALHYLEYGNTINLQDITLDNLGTVFSIEHWPWFVLIALVFLKVLGTSLTLGSGGSGGIFAPSLFIGAMLGGGFGLLTQGFFQGILISPAAYPIVTMLVAMGAMVAASTHAPITAILIIFELTHYNYGLLLPLMVSSIISTLVARGLMKESIYTLKLLRKGINIEEGREVNVLKSIKVKDVMKFEKAVIPRAMTLEDIMNTIVNIPHTTFVVVGVDGDILGSFTLHDFKRVLADYEEVKSFIIAEDLISDEMVFVRESDNLDYAMQQFAINQSDELPVLSDSESDYLGVVWKNDVIKSYNTEILKAEMASGIANRISSIERFKSYEVIPGYSMVEIQVPKKFVGKNLIETDIRQVYSVEVVLIRTYINENNEVKEERIFPSGIYKFKDNDRLLLFGEHKDIDKMQHL